MAVVLEALIAMPALVGCAWYAGAVETLDGPQSPYFACDARRVWDMADFIQKVKACSQLLNGVILAMKGSVCPEILITDVTAEGPMEKFLEDTLVEVRAFDTSYIEVYTDSENIITDLHCLFLRK